MQNKGIRLKHRPCNVNTRMSRQELERLIAMAREENVSQSEIVRKAVALYFNTNYEEEK